MDLRKIKKIDLSIAKPLKDGVTYLYKDPVTNKSLVAKLIGHYNDDGDEYLVSEYKKLYLLSGEPEIGTVYYLVTCILNGEERSCYVMDFIQGKTIETVLQEDQELQYDFFIDLISQLASGLEKSHHYEVPHGDLHEGNVILDELGFVKIIDYAFWGKKIDLEKNIAFDLECFNKMAIELAKKCSEFDKPRIQAILELVATVKSFKNLRKYIQLTDSVTFDYHLLDLMDKKIISLIIAQIPFDVNLSMVLCEKEVDIPDHPEFEQTDQERKYMERENAESGLKLKFSDEREARIEEHFKFLFRSKLHQLKQAGLITWQVWISNSGQKFIGPYKCNYEISFTPKVLQWKRINLIVPFLEKSDQTLNEVLVTIQ